MGTIYYLCGNGLEFELKQFEDRTYALTISYIKPVPYTGETIIFVGEPATITIPITTTEDRDQMLKEIQVFAETTAIRLRNAKDEV